MQLIIAILIYMLVVIVSFLIVYRWYGIRKWSSLIIALLAGWIFLNIIIPPHKSLQEFDNSFLPGIYLLIELLTIPVVLIYTIVVAFRDK